MVQVNTGPGELLDLWSLLRSNTMRLVMMMTSIRSKVRLTERRRVSSDDQV